VLGDGINPESEGGRFGEDLPAKLVLVFGMYQDA
jgi:hypothetical protein